jgi:hypothetical protein
MVHELLERGAKIEAMNSSGSTALICGKHEFIKKKIC